MYIPEVGKKIRVIVPSTTANLGPGFDCLGAALDLYNEFDLNFFSKDFKPEQEYNKLFNSPEKPLFNRALNAYDPGSVWNIVTALAGLESGKFPRETMLDTKPCITYGSQCFREHNDLGFGVIGYEDA